MDMFEKVEKLREKANVSYEDAKAALEAANGDLLDAMIILEKQGKTAAPGRESYSTGAGSETVELTLVNRPEKKPESKYCKTEFKEKLKALWEKLNVNYIVVEHNGERAIKLPIWVFILILFASFYTVLIVMVVSMFFGCRYFFEGEDEMKTANDIMNKAGDVAGKVKDEFNNL